MTRIESWLRSLARSPRALDAAAIALLIALWALFYWRILTPIEADQASFKQGDFSGQFVAFATYQAARMEAGEWPLWNPYNNGGLPFAGDTQAAVFYPPRWITIGIAHLAGGFASRAYAMLQLEAAAHTLLLTLSTYTLIRWMLTDAEHRAPNRMYPRWAGAFGGVIAALVAGYCGFMTGYAPLQLAILEAGAWLPFAVLGILMATKAQRREDAKTQGAWFSGIALATVALALSWLAGHPQTSFFLTYLLIALLMWRAYAARWTIARAMLTLFTFGGLTFALAAPALLPGLEYLTRTARPGLGYDAKGNGFPFQDVLQFAFPSVVSLYSPLYIGIAPLVLTLLAAWRGGRAARFWIAVTGFALVWSFGAGAALYPLLYNVLPGLRFFRGQERAAYLISMAGAILAGLGAARAAAWHPTRDYASALRFRVMIRRAFTLALAFGALVAVAWLANREALGGVVAPIGFGVLMIGAIDVMFPMLLIRPRPLLFAGVIALVAFELFTVNLDSPATYESVPASEQWSAQPPPLVAESLATGGVWRIDGQRGVLDNHASAYRVQDIRGISPLFIAPAWEVTGTTFPNPIAWEVFAVRDVFTDWRELPVPSTIVAEGSDRYGAVHLHRLIDPRPFALHLHIIEIAADDGAALARLRDVTFNARTTAILDRDPALALSGSPPRPAVVMSFAPEAITLTTDDPQASILSIALVDYPGWVAQIDNTPAPLMRAYGVASAIALSPGAHTVTLVYDPPSVKIGVVLAIGALILLAVGVTSGATRKENP